MNVFNKIMGLVDCPHPEIALYFVEQDQVITLSGIMLHEKTMVYKAEIYPLEWSENFNMDQSKFLSELGTFIYLGIV